MFLRAMRITTDNQRQRSFVDTLAAGTRKFRHIVNAKLERWVSEKDTVVAEDGTEQ